MSETTINIHVSGLSEQNRVQEKLKETTQAAATNEGGPNKTINDAKDEKATDTATKSLPMLAYATNWTVRETKKIASAATNYIGTSYGDQATAAQINNAMSVVSTGAGILSATAAGATIGGPVGAVVGAVLGTLSEVVNMGQKYMDYANEQQERTLKAARASERLGIISANKNR